MSKEVGAGGRFDIFLDSDLYFEQRDFLYNMLSMPGTSINETSTKWECTYQRGS